MLHSGVFKSVDGGENWSLLTNSPRPNAGPLAIAPDETLFHASRGIYKSEDEGLNWQLIDTGLLPQTQGFSDLAVDQNDSNSVYAAGKLVIQSTDSGATWKDISFDLPSDSRSIAIDSSGGVYVGTRATGIYRLSKNQDSWETRTHGFPIAFLARDL